VLNKKLAQFTDMKKGANAPFCKDE